MARPRIQRNDPPKDEEPDLSPDIISWGKSPESVVIAELKHTGSKKPMVSESRNQRIESNHSERIAALEERMQRIETKLIALLESIGKESK